MANEEHLKILKQGVKQWNKWRLENVIKPDLQDANLYGADLSGANLYGANLYGANLSGANLSGANLSGVDLSGAKLMRADLSKAMLRGAKLMHADLSDADLSGANLFHASLSGANLSNGDLSNALLQGANLSNATLRSAKLMRANLFHTDLRRADLSRADLSRADLRTADLSGVDLSGAYLISASLSHASLSGAKLTSADLTDADLSRTRLVETDFTNAMITGCRTYGASAWNVTLVGTAQDNLVITKEGEPVVTVDDLEVGQFIYLLLKNEKIRQVLNTIGQKGVLILGRFTRERKAVLDAIRDRLRKLGFVPMMFDFERPKQRDFTETIKTLAGLSRFIIADITNPKSSPLELQSTMPDYMIPFAPIIQEDEEPFSMFRDLKQKYGEWVLDVLEYDSVDGLIEVLEPAVVRPALEKAEQLLYKKTEKIRKRHVKDYKNIARPQS